MKFFVDKETFTSRYKKEVEEKFDAERVLRALEGLIKDKLIRKEKNNYVIVE